MILSSTRESSILKFGESLSEDEDKDLEDTVIKLSECLNVDLRVKDIDIIHRFKKGNMTPKPIIVRFSNYFSKDEMYRSRWKLRNANVTPYLALKKFMSMRI